jgi:alkyl hydroperoxide reductase subunit AhpF
LRTFHVRRADQLENGAHLTTKTAILSTGARWRAINVPGEKEFKNKGIAYCPHCDGPLRSNPSSEWIWHVVLS